MDKGLRDVFPVEVGLVQVACRTVSLMPGGSPGPVFPVEGAALLTETGGVMLLEGGGAVLIES